ncbi:aldehyde dehydrogenase [Fusarium solani]|uniref:aldehyde dehydrogenase (NAD(+)) n=1 Tax=Fusarium solani TaxID=169388 RepID=A0A9P9JME3_FUSSL|nr:aldehyde dehydrogenase [Fusarium solani]KAH7230337.1 aldehyde dehydrogenase [Fusarium solani]
MSTQAIETRLFINGEFVQSIKGKRFPVTNPSNGEHVADVSEADQDDVDKAVQAASAAFPAWENTDRTFTAFTRSKILLKLADLVEANVPEFARLEALSMGRPVATYDDAIIATFIIRYAASAVHQISGKTSIQSPGTFSMSLKQPYGVTGAIIPWNRVNGLPVIMLATKASYCLAAGNTLVLKSSEKAPLTSCLFAKLTTEAGLPGGVFNLVHGFGLPCGNAIAARPNIRKISFTGSPGTGKLIARAAAESNFKNVTLELGGKNPIVVFDDADLDKAAKAAVTSGFFNAGQLCMASSRVLLQDTIKDQFMEAYLAHVDELASKQGDPLHAETLLGPQADEAQWSNITSIIDKGKKAGLNFVRGADQRPSPRNGCFINPAVVLEPSQDEPIVRNEVFGPVTAVNSFSTAEQALEMMNNSEYGLYASVFTKDVARALKFSKRVESGVVAINRTSPLLAFDLPFGGYKMSGSGREFGSEGLETWLETKTVIFDGPA